ncbi:M24 family metallopeptidase, partial [candidate division KSB1 bacterium]
MKRIKNIQGQLRKNKLSVVLISKPQNVYYLCGFAGTNGRLLITPKKAVLITDFRYLRSARKQIPRNVNIYNQKDGIKKLMGRFKTLGIEDEHMTHARFLDYKKKLKGVILKPISGMVEDMRMIKSGDEIRIMKKAVKIANKAFEKFIKTIKTGQSEDEMEWNLLSICRKSDAEKFSFSPIISFGKNTADVHHQKEPNKLRKGEKILIDFGIRYKSYMTDMTRVLYTKKPDSSR